MRNGLATDYYVSPSGSDKNNGTSSGKPWKTISKVNSRHFSAGDRILFQGGASFGGNLSFGSDDTGTAVNPITVSSYGTGRATLNAGSGKGISIYNTAGFVLSHLVVTGNWAGSSQTGNTGNGIEFYTDLGSARKLNFIRVDDVEVRGFKNAGIAVASYPADGTKSGWTDVQITGCDVHDNGDAGITSWGYFKASATSYAHANVVVRNCVVHGNRGIINKGNNSGNGIVLSDVAGATIERCVAHDNGDLNNYAGGGPVGIWTWDSNAVMIRFNESYSNKTGTLDGAGFDLDGGVTNSTLQYNYSHDNQGAGYLVYQFSGARPALSGNTIRYNISENDGRKGGYSGVYLGGGTAVNNNKIYNNTVYIAQAPSGVPAAFKNVGVGSNNKVWNNIFFTSDGVRLVDSVATGVSNLVFQGNDYWSGGKTFAIKWGSSTYSSLSAWRSATSQEKNGGVDTGLQVDPRVNGPGNGGIIGDANRLNQLDAYKLQANSPVKDRGLNLPALFGINSGSNDFYSNPIPQNNQYDIGAHERKGSEPFDVIIDNADTTGVTIIGDWGATNSVGGYYGSDYIQDKNALKGTKSVRFTLTVPVPGNYQIATRWTAGTDRASNVPVDVTSIDGSSTVVVDETRDGGKWMSLGTRQFVAATSCDVLVRTTGTNGTVIVDAVRLTLLP